MEDQCLLPTIARTYKSSLGEARTSSFADRSVNSKKIIHIVRRTSPWKSTARNRSALNTRRRCGKKDLVIRRESGNIGDPVAIRTLVTPEDFTFIFPTTPTNVSTPVRNLSSESSKTIGFTTELLFAHRARSCAVNTSPQPARAARNPKRLHLVFTTLKTA